MLATRFPHIRRVQLEAMLEERTYLTDGQRLFRVISGFASPLEANFALLEDCRTFQAHAFTQSELSSMRLRLVGPPARDVPDNQEECGSMLSICLDCKSKHFSAGRAPGSCSACGSRRIAVISAAGLLNLRAERETSRPGTQG